MTTASRPPSLSTLTVTAGRPPAEPGAPLNIPLTPATAFIVGDGPEYARNGNPTWTAFEDVLGRLEGGTAVTFSSGAAASNAVFDLLPVGAVVVAPETSYHGTLDQLASRERRGLVALRLVDISDTSAVVAALPDATLLWIESPTNPSLGIADIPALCAAAHGGGTTVAVDNTFATPLRQRPLDQGADYVVHSASKLLSGHSDVLLGAVVSREPRAVAALTKRRSRLGATPGVLESWLAARGVRTLAVRLDRAEANARALAERLAERPEVSRVRYPGVGTVVAFEVAAGPEAADAVTAASTLVRNATSLGGVESTWERRRRWATESATVPESLIRMSVGIEDVDDIWHDVTRALSADRDPSVELGLGLS